MSTCQRCGAAIKYGAGFCRDCGAPVGSPEAGQSAALESSFGAEYGSVEAKSRRRRRLLFYGCMAAAVTLLLGVASPRVVEWGNRRRAETRQTGHESSRGAVGGDALPRTAPRHLSGEFPQAVGDYSLQSISERVTEDLRRDSTEAFAASYAAGGGRQVTYVLVRYPTAERARQSQETKVAAMREGQISRAAVAERAPKQDASGRVVGERVVLSMAVLEQVVWTEESVLGMVTARAGEAREFERALAKR
jgi:hypothetical protein